MFQLVLIFKVNKNDHSLIPIQALSINNTTSLKTHHHQRPR